MIDGRRTVTVDEQSYVGALSLIEPAELCGVTVWQAETGPSQAAFARVKAY